MRDGVKEQAVDKLDRFLAVFSAARLRLTIAQAIMMCRSFAVTAVEVSPHDYE
jgi:hypothetical protein